LAFHTTRNTDLESLEVVFEPPFPLSGFQASIVCSDWGLCFSGTRRVAVSVMKADCYSGELLKQP
jgi:hypothetical protein